MNPNNTPILCARLVTERGSKLVFSTAHDPDPEIDAANPLGAIMGHGKLFLPCDRAKITAYEMQEIAAKMVAAANQNPEAPKCLWNRASKKGPCSKPATHYTDAPLTEPRDFPSCDEHRRKAEALGWPTRPIP